MAEVRLPLSGPVVQNITVNPWPLCFNPQPYPPDPPTVSLGTSSKPGVEQEILSEVGSYGRQLGRIGDALVVLLKYFRPDADLTDAEAKAVHDLKRMLEDVADIKERNGITSVLKPSWR
ncbi:MAG: hypothetical protein M0006_05670 [Magnetospirillum sp.]|nr:hypothetical protein [Magnetospirillum sp.]